MNRNVIIWVAGILAVLILLLLIFKSSSPFGKSNTSFGSGPEKEITKIELSEGRQRLILEKNGDNWLINGKDETRKSSVLYILRILEEMKIKSPVSPELFNKEIAEKGLTPVKVKVYERRKLIRSFLVYKTVSNTYGNIMKMRSGSKPFIVYLPGFEGDIGSGFTLNELFWKPYTIFNMLPSEIASVDFENLSDTSNSFTIINNNHRYSLAARSADLHGWDTSLVTRYLSYFTMIPFESWVLDLQPEDKKMIESKKPVYRITVISPDGEKIILSLWEKMQGENSSQIKDSDRLLGKTQVRDEFFIVRYFDIDPLLKKRSYFFVR